MSLPPNTQREAEIRKQAGKKKLVSKLTPALVAQDRATAARAKKYAAPGTKLTMTPGTKNEKPVFHFSTRAKRAQKQGPYGGSPVQRT